METLKSLLQLNEARKPAVPTFTHFVDLKLGVDYTDEEDDDQRGTAYVTVLCQSKEEADAVLKLAKADDISWQEDHDDMLHHIVQNAFDDAVPGYVDAFTESAKLVKAEPKQSRNRFSYRADELLRHQGK